MMDPVAYPEKADGGGQKYIYADDSVNVLLPTLFIIHQIVKVVKFILNYS